MLMVHKTCLVFLFNHEFTNFEAVNNRTLLIEKLSMLLNVYFVLVLLMFSDVYI